MENLDQFYEQVDAEVGRLTELHGRRLLCRMGCCHCCVDDLTVFEVEAAHIRDHCGPLLRQSTPHPKGACAFLDEQGACRIYAHRPYVCRTQGLPLRWIEEAEDEEDGEAYEMRDICPVNEPACDVLDLEADECWTIGPFEEVLCRIQLSRNGVGLLRLSLRSLFLATDKEDGGT